MNATGKSIGGNPQARHRWAVEAKVMLGFGVFACLLVVLGSATFLTYQRYTETDRWVAYTHLELQTLQDLMASVYRVEAGQRGYFISGKQTYLNDRNDAMARIDGQIAKLKSLTRHNPVLLLQVEALSERIAKRREVMAYFLNLYQTKGFAETQKQFGLGPPIMADIRKITDSMQNELNRLLAERISGEKLYGQYFRTLMVVSIMGAMIFFVVMLLRIRRDLALRRQADVEQKRLIDILDASPDLIATATLDGKYFHLNKGGRKLLGIGMDEDISNLAASYMRPEWAIERIHKEAIPAALNTGSWIGETAFINRSGSEIPVSQVVVCHYFEDGSPSHLSTIARDISLQKQTEQAMADAARYDHTHGEVLRIFNASFDRTGILRGMLDILANHHAMPVSAVYLYDEWSGKLHLAAAHAAPPDIAKVVGMGEGLVGDVAQQNRTVVLEPSTQMSELAISTGLLDFVPAALMACPIVYQEKRLGVLVVAASIGQGERDRQFLERLCDQLGVALHNVQQYGDLKLLAEKLRLRSEEINSKNAQLEEASRMKSEFLANMSHELRTPLNAIIGFSEVMRDGLTGELGDKQREYVTDIFESGQHLLALINDVLDLSKIEAGRMVLEEENVDIGSVLHNSLSIIKERATANRIQLQINVPDGVGECRMDPRKVKQMLYNLLSNAVKFTPEGGEVVLRARLMGRDDAMRQQHDFRTPLPEDVEEFLEIAVSDTGIGISAEDMPRLFQPFVQLDGSLARRFEGTGLGLAMVRNLAELHGGASAVTSQLGQGSTFTVWLPYRPAAAPQRIDAVKSTSKAAGKLPLVLVVEDDDRAADLIRLQLEADGCHVVRAATAEVALTMLAQDPLPDLISLDILLPGMDGWDFLAQIKRVSNLAHIPVVILSIVADSNRSKGISLGASEVLQKPVSTEDLAAAMASLGMVLQPGSTVLVVDDDPKAVEIVAVYLEQAGYAVLRTYGGEEAIKIACSHLPDLIVLDLMMPEVNGFAVVETLKKQKKTAGIPILVLTAKMLTPEDRKQLNGYAMQVMEKSEFDHGNFISEVRRALGRKRGNS